MDKLTRHLWRAMVCAGAVIAVLGAVPSAHATYGPNARLDIEATPASVTRSSATLPTYASYRMTITSLDHDRLKKFSFKGTVTTAGATEKATLFAADGAACTLSDAGALKCAIPGELPSYGKTLTFSVTLKVPAAGEAIQVSGKATYYEHWCDWDYTPVASATTTLTAPDPNAVSTYVPASPNATTTLYSGSNTQSGVTGAIPIVDSKTNDPFTTTVIVPAGSPATTAAVTERDLPESCSANPRCFESKLTMPGTFDFLTIILRRDKTTLMSSKGHGHHGHGQGHDKGHGHGHDDDDGRYSGQSSIDNAIVKYFPDDDPAHPERFIIVPNCSVVPGGLPTPKNPCIASRKAYPKKDSHKTPVPAGLEGDWEFVIHAVDNGRYVN
jgi:hypothetical protein